MSVYIPTPQDIEKKVRESTEVEEILQKCAEQISKTNSVYDVIVPLKGNISEKTFQQVRKELCKSRWDARLILDTSSVHDINRKPPKIKLTPLPTKP